MSMFKYLKLLFNVTFIYQGRTWLSPFRNWELDFVYIKKCISVLCITPRDLLLERSTMKLWEIENSYLGLYFLEIVYTTFLPMLCNNLTYTTLSWPSIFLYMPFWYPPVPRIVVFSLFKQQWSTKDCTILCSQVDTL
jgi:hypothetical protein